MSTNTSNATGPARLAAAIASLFVLAVVLSGCSAGAPDSDSGVEAPAVEDGGGDGAAPGEPDSGDSSTENRSIIVTGSMYMTVENPLEAADKTATIVKSAGGRVDARDETAPEEGTGGSAALTLRIPTNRLDAVVEDLRALGTVDNLATTSSDVTNQVTDLDAHISTLRASTKRIEALLVDAKDISDIIKLEDELASRQAELESLEAQQRGLNDQVSLSTIELSLTTVPVAIEDDSPSNFVDGFAAGWNSLVGFVSVALVAFGALLPWLIVMGVILLAVIAAVRIRRSRTTAPVAHVAGETQVAEPQVAEAQADATKTDAAPPIS